MTTVERINAIAEWPQVAAVITDVRDACTQLRWHPALRRRIPEAAVESRVRGACASAELDGSRADPTVVRHWLCAGLPEHPADPAEDLLVGAVRATVESAHLSTAVRRTPALLLSRLHLAAVGTSVPTDQAGRPRTGTQNCAELTMIGPALPAEQVASRLAGITELLTDSRLSATVVAALVHAELATVRPFVRGNAVVARAVERAFLTASGIDPTGVSVPEVGWAVIGAGEYGAALRAYAEGSVAGMEQWIQTWAEAMLIGTREGTRIADAVRAGRLTAPEHVSAAGTFAHSGKLSKKSHDPM
ncbi:hypothetical protein KEM60_01093 [Austwickia sp. TVS 96-490-7B]|uniref:Fic family protein n=1 Tax=Austwickia sp. TVS 96-490-7B TaxID=2830843 RepID=UPI001C561AD1|nr:Fic family protein [Austwickia sp. TVS 96-490-7B]MBW3084903.1 hypothetical protein [Austwickia sp. TVS 96-490-7B]